MLTKNDELEENLEKGAQDNTAKSKGIGKSALRVGLQSILMIAVLFGGFFGMNRLSALKEDPPKRPPFKTVYTVSSVVAERGSFQPKMTVYGEIQAAKTIELRPLVTGKVIEINPELKVGASVSENDMLFKIDPFSFETALAAAKSNVLETRARIAENEANIRIEQSRIRNLQDQLQIAKNDLERISQLRSRGTATAKDVEDRTFVVSQRTQSLEQSELSLIVENARLDQQNSVLDRLQRAITQAERDLADTILYAPVSGVISENNAAVGRYIGPSDRTVSLYEADRLEVRFTLTDQRFGRIQSDRTGVVGREVEVIWSIGGEEFRFPATIDRIGAQIDSNRGGVEVIAVINDGVAKNSLRPGAFVELIVPDKEFENHFRIPETALYEGDTVYAIEDGSLAPRKVRVFAREGNEIIIDGAIENGDEIMTTKIAEISKGIRVGPASGASPQ